MIALLLLALAASTAIDAERAFAADAQKLGQWTAFRKWSAEDALMFVPQQINAQAFLKDRKDPPTSVYWWPGKSFVSCDGTTAINTGPWVRGYGKSVGYFTTVWLKQADGSWKWIYDGGDELKLPRAEGGDIKPVGAACGSTPQPRPPIVSFGSTAQTGGGGSQDGTLRFDFAVTPDGAREFRAWLWDGTTMKPVIEDLVAAPK